MKRVNPGTLVAAVGAALLLVSLFLHWYEPGLNAWTTFEVWDLVLAALAISALINAAADLGWWRGPGPIVRRTTTAVPALVIVAGALINHPPAAVGSDVEAGAWLALAGSLAMVVGAILAEMRISLSLRVDRPTPTAASHGKSSAPERDAEPDDDSLVPEREARREPTDQASVTVAAPESRLPIDREPETQVMPSPDPRRPPLR